MKTAFIGHRHIFDKTLRDKLYKAAEQEIKNGRKCFTMGTRGDFDKEALSVCRELRKIYKDIKIEVVITSFAQLKQLLTTMRFLEMKSIYPMRMCKQLCMRLKKHILSER